MDMNIILPKGFEFAWGVFKDGTDSIGEETVLDTGTLKELRERYKDRDDIFYAQYYKQIKDSK